MIESKASDGASPANIGNYSDYTMVTVYVDSTPPVARITYPAQGGYYTSANLATLSGTANGDVSELQAVEVQIRSNTEVVLAGYGDSSFTHNISGDVIWTTATAISWTSGNTYALEVKATDYANNTQAVISSLTFTVDNAAPNLALTQPPTGFSYWNTLLTISGTANDDSYSHIVATITVGIQNKENNYWWDPVSGGST